jgi:hypothetical protein
MANPVVVRGRIVRYVDKTPMANVLIKLFDACSEDREARTELARCATEKDGKFRLRVNVEARSVCLYAAEVHHTPVLRSIPVAGDDVDTADIPLKPRAVASIDLRTLGEVYAIKKVPPTTRAEVRQEFTKVFVDAVVAHPENRDVAKRLYASDREFRSLVDEGCGADQSECKRIDPFLAKLKDIMIDSGKGY